MFLSLLVFPFLFNNPPVICLDVSSPSVYFRPPCPDFDDDIDNGIVLVTNNHMSAKIICHEGFILVGADSATCFDGKWDFLDQPKCIEIEYCHQPPDLDNGFYGIGVYTELVPKGTVVTYNCNNGFDLKPPESRYRVCEKGSWTGPDAVCQQLNGVCPRPKEVENGYFVPEIPLKENANFTFGQRLHYGCKSGYNLNGPSVQQCLEDGSWSPKSQPRCYYEEEADDFNFDCVPERKLPRTTNIVINGSRYKDRTIQIHCNAGYRDVRSPCKPSIRRCINGRWTGMLPSCHPVQECYPPPAVRSAVIFHLSTSNMDTSTKYSINSQVSYQCLPGYTLEGNDMFTCSESGCWVPVEVPTCSRQRPSSYYNFLSNLNTFLISGATGAGVLGLLLVICLVAAVCRRRKPLSRTIPIAAPVQRPGLGDHASLLHHPDRLALIAFADGIQADQGSLPTYDEATRDRTPSVASRFHRPHWPALGGRRSRNATNVDVIHVTRHGSFASHTPSTRSAADSMGSTDTVAVSEGSTNITLDTASSHSGSQPASCRVHCGSLASFDTSSVVNTDDVPLLEESELEEVQGDDNISLVENPSISDNASFKLSMHSAELN